MKFFKKKLKNGISVVMEKRDLPVVALSISNPFGAGFEEQKVKGIAHFLEHLVFTGTTTRTHEEISREIEQRGGVLNAFTANEVTSFWFKLPSEHLFIGLEILRDILQNPRFDPVKFEKEKKVILEEIKMYHDDPSRAVFDMITENLYEKPFGEPIAGSEKTILPLSRDFVKDYFQKAYSGEGFFVTIVGNVDFKKVCAYFEKNFKLGKGALSEQPIINCNRESVEVREGIDQAHFVFGVHAPLIGTPEYYALEVLDTYLASGMSSRLFLKIREEKGLAYTIQGSINAEKNYSNYTIYTGTTKEGLPEVKKLILEELQAVEKMGEKELKQAKERLIGLRAISSEESAKVMMELLSFELSNKAKEYYQREKKVMAVTLEQVKQLARNMVLKYSTAAIVPK
jgi:predicted Zn-dependent peptidase